MINNFPSGGEAKSPMDNMTYMQPLTGCNNNGSNGQNCRGRKGDSMIIIPCHFLIRGREGNIEILKNKKRLKKSYGLSISINNFLLTFLPLYLF